MRDRLAGLRRQLQDRLRQPKTILPAPESAPTPPSPDNDDDSFLAPPCNKKVLIKFRLKISLLL
mgnify:CR=1 FL=1